MFMPADASLALADLPGNVPHNSDRDCSDALTDCTLRWQYKAWTLDESIKQIAIVLSWDIKVSPNWHKTVIFNVSHAQE